MEIVVLIEYSIRSWVCEVSCFLGFHCHKYLYQRKYALKYTFVHVLFYLIISLTNRYTTFLQLYMNNRHTVNQEHKVTPTVVLNICRSFILRLLNNLVSTLSGCNFVSIINFQANFLPEM